VDIETMYVLVSSLLSALVSSFLAAYLTYRYTEVSWRRRRHFEDIKENCLKRILHGVERFEEHFTLHVGRTPTWVKTSLFFKGPPYSNWCKLFSFGFEEVPTTHYSVLLHDLRNHFPELVMRLRKFEEEMRKQCPLYDVKLYELTRLAYDEAGKITTNIPGRDVLSEVLVMALAGYGDEYWPNDKNFLKNKGLLIHVDALINKLKNISIAREFNGIRNNALSLLKEVKKDVVEILHSQKLPGKCNLY